MRWRKFLFAAMFVVAVATLTLVANFALFSNRVDRLNEFCATVSIGQNIVDLERLADANNLKIRIDKKGGKIAFYSGIEAMCLVTIDSQGSVKAAEFIAD